MDLLYLVLFFVIIAAVVIIFILCSKYEKEKNATVVAHSAKIKALEDLNQKTKFHKVQSCIEIRRHYEKKWQYNKLEPAYLMSSVVRENMDKYALYIEKIRENRQTKIVYDKSVDEISSLENHIDYETIGMTEKSFRKREEKIFKQTILPQYTDCTITVLMSYSSPQGKVNLSKRGEYNFNQLVTSFDSISRSKLDYATYQALAAVERSKVTDSLRYDIMRRDRFRCVICGASANEGVRLHVDHVVPIAKGGKSDPNNLRTLCERCNIGKSDKLETNIEI